MKKRVLAILLCFLMIVSLFSGVSVVAKESESTLKSELSLTDGPTDKVELKNCEITLSRDEYIYAGNEKRPYVTVKYGSKVLKNGKDYIVTYKNNINAGIAVAKITSVSTSEYLKGNYNKTFRILKKDINRLNKKSISNNDYIYNGSAKTPKVSLADTKYKLKLVNGVDFTVEYKDNVEVGIGSVIARGKGNYTGTYIKKIAIRPRKVKTVKAKNFADTTFTLYWSKVPGKVDGYRIYRYDSKTKQYVYRVSTKNTYFNVGGREPATSYKYVVKAYKEDEGKLLLGEQSGAIKVTMKPERVKIKSSGYSGSCYVFKWEKVKSTGYQILYSKNKDMSKGSKVVTVKGGQTTYKKVKLSSKTKYYYRVRAFRKVDGKTVFGEWSDKYVTIFSNVYAEYTTYFNSPAGRTQNIKQACKYIDGTVLSPGETFSFNKVVGQRTPDRGFAVATIFSGGGVASGYGGGVCQVSTTIFNAVLYANLPIVERHQHVMKVDYIPAGRDAAISWGTQDLKFKNNLDTDIKISAKVYDNSRIVIKLMTSTSVKPKKVSLNVSQGSGSYTLRRYVDGKVNYTTYSYY